MDRVVADRNDALTALRAELFENTNRVSLLPTEMAEIGKRIEALEKPAAKERQATTGTAPGKSKNAGGNLPQASSGKTRDRVGAAVGTSGKNYEKIKAVTDAAEADPERFGNLPAMTHVVRNVTFCDMPGPAGRMPADEDVDPNFVAATAASPRGFKRIMRENDQPTRDTPTCTRCGGPMGWNNAVNPGNTWCPDCLHEMAAEREYERKGTTDADELAGYAKPVPRAAFGYAVVGDGRVCRAVPVLTTPGPQFCVLYIPADHSPADEPLYPMAVVDAVYPTREDALADANDRLRAKLRRLTRPATADQVDAVRKELLRDDDEDDERADW